MGKVEYKSFKEYQKTCPAFVDGKCVILNRMKGYKNCACKKKRCPVNKLK